MSSTPVRPRRGRPPQPGRRDQIADAAVRLLAESGGRGLSHRRVDKEAGLPLGSTVNYAPSRTDLFLMAAQRLLQISLDELQPMSARVEQRSDALTPDDVATELLALWRGRLGQEQLYRLRAEMAIWLSADRPPEMNELFQPQASRIITYWQDMMSRLGSVDPKRDGYVFSQWTRGMFYMFAVQGGVSSDNEYEQMRTSIVELIRSLIGEPALTSEANAIARR